MKKQKVMLKKNNNERLSYNPFANLNFKLSN